MPDERHRLLAPRQASTLLPSLYFLYCIHSVTRMTADAASLAALSEAFPGFSTEQLATALGRHHGDVDAAAAAILHKQVCGERTGACKFLVLAATALLLATHPCWNSPTICCLSRLPLQPGSHVVKGGGFKGRRKTSWGSLGEASGQPHGRPPMAPRFTARQGSEQGPTLNPADFPAAIGNAPPSVSGGLTTRLPAAQPHASPQPHRLHWSPPQPAPPPSDVSPAGQQLLKEHAWAGEELVAAVLAAMQGDAAAAAAALAEMVADGSSSADRSARSRGNACASASRAGQAPATTSWASDTTGEEEGSAEEQQDPYYRHRRRALQLSRRWGRAARGAGVAYAAGEHSAARQLATEAQRLRREALAAHAEAAARIEEENNRGNRCAACAGAGGAEAGAAAICEGHRIRVRASPCRAPSLLGRRVEAEQGPAPQ